MELNYFYNCDCIEFMKTLPDNSVDLVLTDIPYDGVNRGGDIRKLDKDNADIITFNLDEFIKNCYRICKGTIIIFCGVNQLSQIYSFFADKDGGTVRQLVWQKTNPSPVNGEYIYLSGIENAIWFKKSGATFNAFCKNTVFKHPSGTSELHPTEKNHSMLEELILDNSNENDIVFDPCAGSGSTLLVAYQLRRQFIGCELYKEYYEQANERLQAELSQMRLF